MTNKITKRVRFETLLTFSEVQTDPGMVEFIQNELALLDKKKAAGRTNPNADGNAVLEQAIADYMEDGKKYRISELMAAVPVADGRIGSTSLYSARIKALIEQGVVVKTTEKGNAYFSLA